MVEPGPFGGTCLNRGCIPSKLLIHCADVMETVKNADKFGIRVKVEGVDWAHIMERASHTVDEEAHQIEEGNRATDNIEVFKTTARFVDNKVLEVDGERITAPTIVIAAGTRPTLLDIPGIEAVAPITSDEALRLPAQPRRMAIVGGGFIAAEMAHFFGTLGTEVTIIHRRDTMLREEDEDVARRFTEIARRKFNFLGPARIRSAARVRDGVELQVEVEGAARTVVVDTVLFATGRRPNTDSLAVSESGIAVDERGYVAVDEYLETNVPGVWALGDIVGRYLLKHSANLEAAYVAHNIFNPTAKVEVDYHAMPHAIFASPQIGSVGITEQDARAQNLDYVTATYDYKNTAYGESIGDEDGFVKVIADRSEWEILGCHVIGAEASILVQEAVNAMRGRLGIDAINQSIYIHPALPEVIQRAFGALER